MSEARLEALQRLLQAKPRTHAFVSTVTVALFKVTQEGLRGVAEVLVQNGAMFDSPELHYQGCWFYFEVLSEAVSRSVQGCCEDEARPLVDKANALLDLPIVNPPLLRFTLSPGPSQEDETGAESPHQRQTWIVDTVLASLESLCRAAVRRSLLPWPLEPKIQALPIPPLIQDLLMPLNRDGTRA